MSNSLEYQCESAVIVLLQARSGLSGVNMAHHDADSQLEMPAIVVTAIMQDELVSHPTRAEMRVFEMEVTIELRGESDQTDTATIDAYFAEIEAAILSSNWTVMRHDPNERGIEEDMRVRVRKFKLITQFL